MDQQTQQAGYDQQTLASFQATLLEERLRVQTRLQKRNGPIFVEELNGAERTDRAQVYRQNESQILMNEQFLADINEALVRIKAQNYGFCQCGQLIPLARLVIIPTAKSCVACQVAKKFSHNPRRGRR